MPRWKESALEGTARGSPARWKFAPNAKGTGKPVMAYRYTYRYGAVPAHVNAVRESFVTAFARRSHARFSPTRCAGALKYEE